MTKIYVSFTITTMTIEGQTSNAMTIPNAKKSIKKDAMMLIALTRITKLSSYITQAVTKVNSVKHTKFLEKMHPKLVHVLMINFAPLHMTTPRFLFSLLIS
jgi:hypothetical protein